MWFSHIWTTLHRSSLEEKTANPEAWKEKGLGVVWQKINFSEDLNDLWTLSDQVGWSRFVNPLLEVSPTFYENQQLFSTLDRWAYHPTHGWPISVSQILSYVFLWFRNIYFSDSVSCISINQVFSTLDRWAYHPTHSWPISVICIFFRFWNTYFSDSVTGISLIQKHIFFRFCIVYFSESGVLQPW